jgi:hypothetical protein
MRENCSYWLMNKWKWRIKSVIHFFMTTIGALR